MATGNENKVSATGLTPSGVLPKNRVKTGSVRA